MNQLTSLLGRFLAPYRPAFRLEAFRHFVALTAAWILAPRKRTIAQVARTADFAYGTSHHDLYHLVGRASFDQLRLDAIRLGQLVERFAPHGVVEVAIDDTLSHKRGAKVYGGGIYLDPVFSSRARKNFRFGINWLVVALVVRVPGRGDRTFAVPVAWRLCPKRTGASQPKRTEIARDLLAWLAGQLTGREVRILGDSAYLNRAIAKSAGTESLDFLGPMPLTAALFGLPPERLHGKRGAPRKKGDRLPKPADTFAAWERRGTRRFRLKVGGRKAVEVRVVERALWYGTFGSRVGRVLLVRDPSGGWRDTALWTTDLTTPVRELLQSYGRRWGIEVLFRDSKQLFGLHDAQVRDAVSVVRAHGQAWVALAEVIRWYAEEGHQRPGVRKSRPWYAAPPSVTITDMLETMRLALWEEVFSREQWKQLPHEKLHEALIHWISEVH